MNSEIRGHNKMKPDDEYSDMKASTIMEFVEYFKVKINEYPHTKINAQLLLENLTHKFVRGVVNRGEIHVKDSEKIERMILENINIG